jgi:hypothetical protein
MTCETCGEKKPKNDSASFTKATVEILNPKELTMFRKVTVPASMGDDTANPPRVGKYCNVILYYEANNQAYIYSSDGIPTRITEDLTPILNKLKELDDEDKKIWEEIEEIEMSSDVVDIVGTYAELQQYDTSKLHDNDIIKVLQDETHLNETAYYRWSTTTDTFSYVGSEGPYYTESEVDNLLSGKQDTLIAGTNIQIAADGKTISATDTTYTAGDNISISAQNVISATDSGATVFYTNRDWLLSTSTTVLIYKDAALTTPATSLDIYNASTEGSVIIAFNYDKTTPNTDAFIYTISESYYEAEDNEYTFSGMVSYNPVKTFYISEYGAPGSYDIVIKELQDKLTAGSNIQINGTTISATDTTYTHFTGATASADGVQGLVPGPLAGDQDKYLKADGTWATPPGTTYAAGTGIDITNNTIAIDNTVVQEKLTAGSNISISGATISATDTTYTAGTGIAISAQNAISASPNNISSNDWSALWQ